MLNLNGLILTSEHEEVLVDFYTKILGRKTDWSGGRYHGWKVGTGFLVVGYHDKTKGVSKDSSRLMFNFETADVQGEFDRMVGLGATVIAKPYHPGEDTEDKSTRLATLADPDGNYFQLVSPMPMQ